VEFNKKSAGIKGLISRDIDKSISKIKKRGGKTKFEKVEQKKFKF